MPDPHPLCLALFALAAATPAPAEPAPSLQNQRWPLRHADGLLHREDLQEIVAAQCARDAAALEGFFDHRDPLVRARAAFAAGSVQDAASIPKLLELLRDPDRRVRLDAAFALRQTAGAPAEPLLKRLAEERDGDVRAMLLAALGLQGDRDSYERAIGTPFPGGEIASILCAIYYLQRDIVSPGGIERMLAFLPSDDPAIREHAAYFFYTLTRRKTAVPGLAEKLAKRVRGYRYDEPAAPYLLRYIAAQRREGDLELLLRWYRNGDGARARSVAVEGLKYFTSQARVRETLIEATGATHFHVADTAAEILSTCGDLAPRDLEAIKAALAGGRVRSACRPHLWAMLWRRGEQEFVEKAIASIPDRDQVALIAAISCAPDIALAKISADLDALLASTEPQVNIMTGTYLAGRLSHSAAEADFAIFERFLDTVPDKRTRCEALFELAHSIADHLRTEAAAARFRRYHDKFLEAADLASAASCLVLMGATRQPSALPTIRAAAASPEAILREGARGALSLHRDGPSKQINHYDLDFAPVLELDWDLLRRYGRHPKLVMTTKLGELVIELDAEQAPMATQNLIVHTEAGRFDGLYLYRVVPNHVIQAGPQGNFGYRILSEFTRVPKVEHSFGMGDYGKDTASQHIAITHLMRPHNEGKYTNLGLVVAGRDIVKDVDKFDLITKTRALPDRSADTP